MRHGLAGLLLSGSALAAAADLAPLQSGLDYHSFANIEQFRVTRLEIDLRVDMKNQELDGIVGLHVKRLDPRATQLVLDTRDLTVLGVSEKAQGVLGATAAEQTTWVSRPFHFDRRDPVLGSALVIELPPSTRPSEFIKIEYETTPAAPGLRWLTEAQSRHKPFLYTRSTPIGARSWLPLQDTPQVRVTYKALVHTPSDLRAVMSAVNDPKARRNGEYAFDMPEPIPPHLIALAVGDLAFKELGPRTGVYAQKSVLKAAAAEFADAEALVAAGEKLFGPYRFGRFDSVVMPAAFPGLDSGNPRLAFLTPTAIAGDGSLEPILLGALAQAWSGNLVAPATWRDRWLAQGLGDYVQGRLADAAYGGRRATLATAPAPDAVREPLALDLRGRDPAEVHDSETGRLVFDALENRFGRERFDEFLRGYLDHFAFGSVTTEDFLRYLDANLLATHPGVVGRKELESWIFGSEMPSEATPAAGAGPGSVEAARRSWLEATTRAKSLDTRGWSTRQWIDFLDSMPVPQSRPRMEDLDRSFGLTRSANAEVLRSWLKLAIRSAYQPAYARLSEYLVATGRTDLILPLYAELSNSSAGRARARQVFAKARAGYDAEAVAAVESILKPPSGAPESADEQ